MPSSTNFAAGAETSAVVLAHAIQSDGAVFPTSGWKGLRITQESLGIQQQTSRPNEITGRRQVSPSVIQQVRASGEVGFNLSYGTFDDLWAALFGNDWTAALAINSATTDITFVNGTNKITSTSASKFAAIVEGQWIRIFGATASAGANNGIRRVVTKTSDQDITVTGPLVAETSSGTNIAIRGAMLRNGDQTQLVAFQKQLGASQFLRYPAGMIGAGSLRGSVGNFMTGSFSVMAREELFNSTTAGSVAAAPGGGFFNCVSNFGGISLDDTVIDAVVQSLDLTISREGADMVYGMGSDAAQGNIFGQVNVAGSISVVWRNETIYNLMRAGTLRTITAVMRDPAGAAYAVTLPTSALRNGSPQAGGPNQSVVSNFTIEGAQNQAIHAIQLDRLPATAA
ncbi:MAG TPA: phage tail tube protein [Roseococcus sp.]|jgi:hypothetical protein|nr:phage tail tube protein [Roseococcus sp.]